MSKRELAALKEKGIRMGDEVRTAFRGGVRQGKVKEITKEPKVVFTRKRKGQPDKEVRHNPSTLEKVAPGDEEKSEELAKARSAVQRSGRGRATAGGSKAAHTPEKAVAPKARGGVSKQAAGKSAAAAAGKEQAPASPKTPTKPPLRPRRPAATPAASKGVAKVRGSGGKRKAAASKAGTRGSGRLATKAKASRRG